MHAQLLHLAGKMRAAGFFAIVAVTKPFAFEGPRKMEAANFLISQLAEHANVVAVVEQVQAISSCAPSAATKHLQCAWGMARMC